MAGNDAGDDGGSGPADLASSDMTTPIRWSAEPAAVPITVNLRGVTGGVNASGMNDVWIVGTGGYVKWRSPANGQWAPINAGDNTLTIGRVVYVDKGQAWALAVPPGVTEVIELTTTTASIPDVFHQPTGQPFYDIWASAPPNPVVYVLTDNGTVSFATPMMMPSWNTRVPASGALVSGLSKAFAGQSRAPQTEFWATFGNDQQLAALAGMGNWTLVRMAKNFSGVWATATPGGVWYVGSGGRIAYANTAGAGPYSLMDQTSGVTVTLQDAAGTPDGKHLFAVGDGGAIVRCDNPPCASWTPDPSGVTANLYGVWASSTDVYAVGDSGTILHRSQIGP